MNIVRRCEILIDLVSSFQVLDVLPSIGQYDPDHSPAYVCSVCNATLPVTEKVTNSRGQLRTILATPKKCHKCGEPTTEYQTLAERDLHESVLDTLHRGDPRFIVDHRRFQNLDAARFSPKMNSGIREASSPMDWRDDIESFRLHMSRQSEREEDLDTRDQEYEQKRSESGSSSVFMTEPGTNIDKLNEPPDVRRAWDDGTTRADITRDDGNDSEDWVEGKENRSYSTDLDAYSDFQMIEDYDPESGFTVRLRRRPFGGAKQTSYVIHGIQDEFKAAGTNSMSKGGKRQQYAKEKNRPKKQGIETDARHHGKEKNRHSKQGTDAHQAKTSEHQDNKQTSTDRKTSKRISHDVNENEEKIRENDTSQNAKHPKNTLSRTESFYTVGLDQRDYVFSESPIIEEVVDEEDDIDIIFPSTRFSDDTFSDFEFHGDDWSPGSLDPGSNRPTIPTPIDDQVIILLEDALSRMRSVCPTENAFFYQQEDVEYSSSLSISPEPHDGYLADSEENADLSSLQAQIQQARNNAKKYQKRKEEGQEIKRKESREKKAKDQQSQGQF